MTRKDAEKHLKKQLTPELIETLVLATRVVGWGVDLCEIFSFIRCLQEIAELPLDDFHDIESFPYDEDDP